MSLIGETTRSIEPGERVSINISPSARTALRELLWQPEMRGVGYSEFIIRAVEIASWEIHLQREDSES